MQIISQSGSKGRLRSWAGVRVRPLVKASPSPALTALSTDYKGVSQAYLGGYLTSLNAGGPGSGCHGDNCGRPSKGGETAVKKLYVEI